MDPAVPSRTWELSEDIIKQKLVPLLTAQIILVPSPNGERFLVKTGLPWYLADGRFHLLTKVDFGIVGYAHG